MRSWETRILQMPSSDLYFFYGVAKDLPSTVGN